jgi:Ca2+-binding RTX toxin-like protein
MTTQNVTMRNVAGEPCVLHADDLQHVVLVFGDERTIDVDLSTVGGSRFLLQPGGGVSLDFGADSLSADCGPFARTLRVTFAGEQPVTLEGAWVAVGCERPKAIEVYRGEGGASTGHPSTHAKTTGHRLAGTNGDGVLVGTPGRDVIDGLHGTDIIRGRAGDDELRDYSGVGTGRSLDTTQDAFYGGPGDDLIFSSQHDRVFAGPGDDRIYADYLKPGDVIHCGTGWDVVTTNDVFPGIVLRGCEKLRVEYAG